MSFLGTLRRGNNVSISPPTTCWSPDTFSSMSHPSPLPPPAHVATLFSTSPVVPPITPPYPSSIAGTSEPDAAPHTTSASRFTEPPWCTSDGIRPPCQTSPAPGCPSTTPSSWPMIAAAPTRWSPVVLPGSPSPWVVYNSPSLPLPGLCLRSHPLSIACSRTPTGVAL
jgi:hypothetical protein